MRRLLGPTASASSCAVFLLTTIIGNFGVSDADVVIRQEEPTFHHRRDGTSSRSLSSNSENAINLKHYQQSLLDLYSKDEARASSASTNSLAESPKDQLHFRNKEGDKNADGFPLLEDSESGIDLGYPLPLSMDDYWALGRDRLLDQLVIRALANPEEWSELRKSLEKVDGDLKALLSLVKRKNQATPDGSTNSSLGYGPSYAATSSSISSTSSSSPSSTGNQQQHHHGLKWKFTYHRVRDLNAAGQPRSRGIAAVVSLDTAENETSSSTGSGSSSGDSGNLGDSPVKASKTSSSTFGKDGGARGTEVKDGAEILASSSHFDDPIEMLIPRGGGTPGSTTTSSSRSRSSTNGNNNIISNSFSRFGNKEKHVDLASDKSSGGSGSSESDNSRKSGSVSNSMPPSALVLPTEMESQGNEPNSHKIQWDPRHGQGGGGDEVLATMKEVRQQGQEGNDEHHPARHHHHRDHHYHKNYHHHQPKHHFQHQLSSFSARDDNNDEDASSQVGPTMPATVGDELSSRNSHHHQHHSENHHQLQSHHSHHHNHHDQASHPRHHEGHHEKEQNHHHIFQSNHHQQHHHREHGNWKRFHMENSPLDE